MCEILYLNKLCFLVLENVRSSLSQILCTLVIFRMQTWSWSAAVRTYHLHTATSKTVTSSCRTCSMCARQHWRSHSSVLKPSWRSSLRRLTATSRSVHMLVNVWSDFSIENWWIASLSSRGPDRQLARYQAPSVVLTDLWGAGGTQRSRTTRALSWLGGDVPAAHCLQARADCGRWSSPPISETLVQRQFLHGKLKSAPCGTHFHVQFTLKWC